MQIEQSMASRLMRWRLNFFPAYRRTGARVQAISHDWKRLRIRLPLTWRTRNYVGTLFGGSLYAAADPIYMVMLINLLGREYIVWDKAAEVQFLKPGRSTVYADFEVTDQELALIRDHLEQERTLERHYLVELKTAEGEVCARVDKLLYFRKK